MHAPGKCPPPVIVYNYILLRKHIRMFTPVRKCAASCTHHTHTHTHTHTHARTHAHTDAYTHAHTRAHSHCGQVGYAAMAMRNAEDAHVGDTFHHLHSSVTPLPGFSPAKPMVGTLCSRPDELAGGKSLSNVPP